MPAMTAESALPTRAEVREEIHCGIELAIAKQTRDILLVFAALLGVQTALLVWIFAGIAL